jgi:hypothetical protein
MAGTRHFLDIPLGAQVTLAPPTGLAITVDASSQLQHAVQQAGVSAKLTPPATWEVDVPDKAALLFKLAAFEVLDKYETKSIAY